jgi:hypothetical protein
MTNMSLRSSFRAKVTIMQGTTSRSAKVEKLGAIVYLGAAPEMGLHEPLPRARRTRRES